MTQIAASALDRAIQDLPLLFKGPGGGVAVVKDGAVVARHAWGFANLAERVPFSPRTLMPICSITKQFTCAVLLDQVGDPSLLDAAVAARLPLLEEPPRTADLCNNQSGLRDYWALTVLCGAAPEGDFRPEDAKSLMGRTRTLHFAPGTQYSYSNGNFRILSDLIEDRLGRPFSDMLNSRILGPAGMEQAQLSPETSQLPGDAVGYEGDSEFGFVPAVNRINWTGDAGISASLDDMIAWERFIDATRDDADGLYRRLSTPQTFSDGKPARYGFGLAQMESEGVAITGHGGALRGWRSQRLHAASERLSVVVLFNHSADARDAALHVFAAALGQARKPALLQAVDLSWAGTYLDEETDLVLGVEPASDGRLTVRFTTTPETLVRSNGDVASSPSMSLQRQGTSLRMERPGDNLYRQFGRVEGPAQKDVEGIFHAAELDATFTCVSAGGAIYGGFDGFLGRGAMQPLYAVAPDIWLLPCQRAMDAHAPGDWTVHFRRNENGAVTDATIGCWLARRLRFSKR